MNNRHTQDRDPYVESSYSDPPGNGQGRDPYPYGQYGHPAPPYGPGTTPDRTGRTPYDRETASGGLAVACLTLGIVGFFSGFLLVGIALDVLAIVLGIVSLSNGKPKKGLAVSGILIAVSSILLTMVFYFLLGRTALLTSDSPQVTHPTPEQAAASSLLMEQISLQESDTGNGVLLIYDNGNPSDVNLTIHVSYYDENGKMLSFREEYLWGCAAQGRAAMQASPPYDRNYDIVPYDHYEIDTLAEAADPSYQGANAAADLEISADLDTRGEVLASVGSLSGKSYSSVELACIYYKNGIPVGISREYLWDFEEKQVALFYTPYDAAYQELSFDSFEIIVNDARE